MNTFLQLNPLSVLDTNECLSSPCMNGGQCVDSVNGYTCECPNGYTDEHCQTGMEVQYYFSLICIPK